MKSDSDWIGGIGDCNDRRRGRSLQLICVCKKNLGMHCRREVLHTKFDM